MKKVVVYTLVALLTFVGFIVAFAPAALLWRQVEPELTQAVPDLSVVNVRGSIWRGTADLFYRQFPPSLLEWSLAPLPLLTSMAAATELKLSGDGHDLTGLVTAADTQLTIQSLTGFVDAIYINRVSQPQGLTFAGRVSLENLDLESDLRWVQMAQGQVTWPGGRIVSRTRAAGTRVFELPALTGDIGMQGQNIVLTLHPNDRNQTLLDVVIRPDGWVAVAVKARLFDLAGLPWPGGSSLDDTVLEFEEQVLRGAP